MVSVGPCLPLYWFPLMKTQMYGGNDRLVASLLLSLYISPGWPWETTVRSTLAWASPTTWDSMRFDYTYMVWKASFESIPHTDCSLLESVVVVASKVMLWSSFNCTTEYLLIWYTPRRGLMSWIKLHTDQKVTLTPSNLQLSRVCKSTRFLPDV